MTVRSKMTMAGLALAVGVLTVGGPALASHYRIVVLEEFEPEQVEALHAAGVHTTEDFVRESVTSEQRAALSGQTGISELETLVFARLCELLQIEGVGPRAAQLLRASGVVSAEDLAGRDPAELVERVTAVNAVEQLTGINPTVENLSEWISRAAQVPYHVQ